MRMTAEAIPTTDGVPLELAPLMSLYGRNRRLSLRVERLPERARLSRGRNNGDRSWSLMRDDLDGLRYLPPEGMKGTHTLSVRIINLDTDDGATLAVLDFPVAAPLPQAEDRRNAVSPSIGLDHAELERLRGDCAEARASLAARDGELAEARQLLLKARADATQLEESRAAARTAWQIELQDRLAAARVEAEAKLEQARLQWQSDESAHIADARMRWQREADTALTRAKEAWKAEENARLAQAEAQWGEHSAYALSEAKAQTDRLEAALARAEAEATRMSGDAGTARQLHGELAQARAYLATRDRELAQTRQMLEQARAESLKSKSELATARAEWETELERRLADLRGEFAANQPVRIEEDQVSSRLERAREQWRQESEAALARAKEAWKSDEAVKLARIEAQWREQSAQTIAESAARVERAEAALARAQAHALHETSETAELRRVREELAEVRTVLLDREARLSQARLEMKRARERWKSEADIALKNAQEAWKAEEAYRISIARGDWQRDLRNAQDVPAANDEELPRNGRRLLLDGFVAAALAVAVVVLYPTAAQLLAAYWPDTFGQSMVSASASAPLHATQPSRPAPLPPAPLPVDVVTHGANMRSTPSPSGAVLARLARGTKVTALAKNGSWVRVQTAGDDGVRQGWVFGTFLKDTPDTR